MSTPEKDAITVVDRSRRRRFIRTGAAFVLTGAAAAKSGNVFADDCDRNAGEKNAQAPGSDSDAGEGADPTGCGRRPPPKISSRPNKRKLEKQPNSIESVGKIVV